MTDQDHTVFSLKTDQDHAMFSLRFAWQRRYRGKGPTPRSVYYYDHETSRREVRIQIAALRHLRDSARLSSLRTEITRMRDEAQLLAGSEPNIADRDEAAQRALVLDDVLALLGR